MTTGLPPLPACTCPWQQDHHDDTCPHYIELLVRQRLYWYTARTM